MSPFERRPPPVAFSLTIDSVANPVGRVHFLHQDDPWPGGHLYVMKVEGHAALGELGLQPVGSWTPDRREMKRLMLELEWLIAKATDGPREGGYLINTIDRVEATASAITLTGRCSTARRET